MPGQQLNDTETVHDRLRQLEARSILLTEQLQTLKMRQDALERLPAVDPADGTGSGVTMKELKAEVKRFAWKKGDLTITPYGRVVGSFVYETQRSFPGYIILWMNSFSDDAEDACYFDARSTRLGLDIAGPKVFSRYGTKVSGKVEIDFQSTAAPRQNQGLLMFRRG